MSNEISSKLYISTLADDAAVLAREHGFGLEIVEFCTALNFDTGFSAWDAAVREKMKGVESFTFHAPFNELCPAAIDPLILDVTRKRFAQAFNLMTGYGINTMIAHSGFIPNVYFEEWFVEKSVTFWWDYLSDKPEGFRLYLENVLESSPDSLIEVAAAINDERFRLCLDIGHAAILEPRMPILEWVERMLPFLGHIHLHNNYGKRDTHNALGDGDIDVAEVIRMVTKKAPGATFTLETSSAETSVSWLRTNGFGTFYPIIRSARG